MSGERLLPLLAALAIGCAATLPPEPPSRVLTSERDISVVGVSRPSGLEVWSLEEADASSELLGTTPLEIVRLTLGKEIWKYGEIEPPAGEDGPLLEHRRDADGEVHESTGEALRWSFLVGPADAAGERRAVEVTIPAEILADGFRSGQLTVDLTPPPGATR